MPSVNRETSLYLDLIRFLCASIVFLGHLSGHRFTGGFLWQLAPFMGDAVTIFFVLSGFVISYATECKETHAAAYAVARLARIYSVALPALVLTFILDTLGQANRPDLYSEEWGFIADKQLWQYASGLLFLNQIWFLDIPVGSDLPYWSLGFEVWYYAIFGVAVFAPARRRVAGVVALIVLVGPKIITMFPLWLLGLITYRITARRQVSSLAGWALFLSSTLAFATHGVYFWNVAQISGQFKNLHNFNDAVQSYLIGFLFSINILGFSAISQKFNVLSHFADFIRWTAGATFTIYLMHLPIAQFLITIIPWSPETWISRITLISSCLLLLYLTAEMTERRKRWWHRHFSLLLMRPVVSKV